MSTWTRHGLEVGKAVGEFEVGEDALVGVFVAKDASTCYEVTVADFGRGRGDTHKTILRSGNARMRWDGHPTRLLVRRRCR